LNLTGESGSGRAFTYDDENPLASVEKAGYYRTEFTYDGQGRLRVRKEFSWSGGWLPNGETRYVYDGSHSCGSDCLWLGASNVPRPIKRDSMNRLMLIARIVETVVLAPILFVIVALGAMRPNTWTLFAIVGYLAIPPRRVDQFTVAATITILTIVVFREWYRRIRRNELIGLASAARQQWIDTLRDTALLPFLREELNNQIHILNSEIANYFLLDNFCYFR